MALITSFRDRGHCSRCGAFGEVWVQSHLGDEGATYRVGDAVGNDVSAVDISMSSFLIRPPMPTESTSVLSSWDCEACKWELFAELVFDDDQVIFIRPVELSNDLVGRLNYVEQGISDLFQSWTGHKIWDENGDLTDLAAALRRYLSRS